MKSNSGALQDRDDEEFTPEELLDDVELTLNYDYTDPGRVADDASVWVDTFSVPITNHVITESDATDFYNAVLEFIDEHNESIGEYVTHVPKLYDLEEYNLSSGSVEYIVTSVVSTTLGSYPFSPKAFGSGDDWDARINKCASSNSSSAPKQLAKYANWNLNEGPGYYLYNISFYDLHSPYAYNPSDPTPTGDFILDYYLWYVECCFSNQCLNQGSTPDCPQFTDQTVYCIDYYDSNTSAYEMAYYLSRLENDIVPTVVPMGKFFGHITFDYRGRFYNLEYNIHFIQEWYGKVYYGEKDEVAFPR